MKPNKVVFAASLIQFVLITFSSLVGILTPGFYSNESLNWQTQSAGQDAINLVLITPCLVSTLVLTAKKRFAILLWGGVNLYITYTFSIYCFDIHFNKLFIIYCLILGLSFYLFLYSVYSPNMKLNKEIFKKPLIRIIAYYLVTISSLFYFLWLSETLPAILTHTIPNELNETGLFTNPIKVLDLSILLPGVFITAVFLLKQNEIGLLFVPIILSFFILMDITIGALIIVMKSKGIEADYIIAVVMAALALFSSCLLVKYLRLYVFSCKNCNLKH